MPTKELQQRSLVQRQRVHPLLRNVVQWQGDDLVLRRRGSAVAIMQPWVIGYSLCSLAVVPLSGLAIVIGLVLVLAQPALWVWVLLAVCAVLATIGFQSLLVVMSTSFRAWQGEQIRLGRHGWIDVDSRARAPGPIQIAGKPGCRMVVHAGARELLVAVPPPDGPWSYEAISWYAQTMGELWQQPVDDQRDAEAWERWRTDPDARAASGLERQLDDNFYGFRTFHEVPAAEPEAEHGLHEVSYVVAKALFNLRDVRLTFTPTTVSQGDLEVSLADIARVYLLYARVSSAMTKCEVNLLMVDGTVQRLVETAFNNGAVVRCGPLNAMPALLERYIAEARAPAASGAESEVPAALRALTKGRCWR